MGGVSGKYFIVTSKLTGYALDIKGGSGNPGTSVVMWGKHGQNNQQWFFDPITSTIRSRLNPNLCLTINGSNRLVVDYHRPGDVNQTWVPNEQRNVIENRSNANRVLDVIGSSRFEGAEICAWDYHGGDNQGWKLEFQPKRYFFIKSELNGKVWDVEGGNANSGTRIIMWHQKGGNPDNQLWFEDGFGNLRSKLNESVVLNAADGTLRLSSNDGRRSGTHWSIQGNRIVNVYNPSEVLDIKGENTCNGAEICAWGYKGSANQHWRFEYIN